MPVVMYIKSVGSNDIPLDPPNEWLDNEVLVQISAYKSRLELALENLG